MVWKFASRVSPNGTISGSSGHPSPLSDDVTQPILLSHSFLMFLFLFFSLEGLDAPDAVGVRRILLHHAVLRHSTVIWRKKKSEACRTKKGTLFLLNSASHFVKAVCLPQSASCAEGCGVKQSGPGSVWRGRRTLCLSACVLPFLSLQHHDHCGPVQRACLWVRQ